MLATSRAAITAVSSTLQKSAIFELHLARHGAVGAAEQDVGLDADREQLLDGVLGRLGLQLLRGGDPRDQRHMNKDCIVTPQVLAHLANRFEDAGVFHVDDRRFPNGRSVSAFGAGWRLINPSAGVRDDLQPFQSPSIKMASCLPLRAKRFDDLISVTSCLQLGQGPRRPGAEGRPAKRSCGSRPPGRAIVFQTREVGTVAALEGYRKVDADKPTQ